MSDSNQPPKAMTLLEQFNQVQQDVEILKLQNLRLTELVLASDNLGKMNDGLLENTVDVLDALLRILYAKGEVTQSALTKQVTQDRANKTKQLIDFGVDQGQLVEIETVEGPDTIVSFKIEEKLPFGYGKVADFSDPQLVSDIVGKKSGDKIGQVEIIKAYKRVEQQAPSAQ